MAGLAPRRARTLAALSVSAVLLAACNLLTGLDADYQMKDGASTGDGDGGPNEAGETDGPRPDADPIDAPADSGGDTSKPPAFCATLDAGANANDFFCDDFETTDVDDAGAPTTTWTGVLNAYSPAGGPPPPGKLALMPGAGFASKSRGLVVESDSTTSSSRQTRFHFRFLNAKPAADFLAYELDFDFRLEASALDYEALGLLVFTTGSVTDENGLAGYVGNGGALHYISREAPLGTVRPVNDGKWHHFSLRLEHTTAGTTFERTIKLDDGLIDNKDPGHKAVAGSFAELRIGIFNTSGTPGHAKAYFDNVVLRRR